MNLLAKFLHGSHLYGLNTSTSDVDYKGVYMPSLDEIILGDYKDTINLSTNKSNTRNTQDDVDHEVYSLHKFVKLLSKGEMVCFDMLFAPEKSVQYFDQKGEVTRDIYDLLKNPVYLIRQRRDMFVHRDMKAYLGYCRRQAAKYGVKGSRLDSLFLLQTALEGVTGGEPLARLIPLLPENEFLKIEENHYEVLGKKHQWNTDALRFRDRIAGEINKYGHRAKLARENEGVDWKAVSHAFRAGYQLKSMLLTGRMEIVPSGLKKEAILNVKNGKLDWCSQVKPALESLMDEVENLAEENPLNLPEKVDIQEVNDTLVADVKNYYGVLQ